MVMMVDKMMMVGTMMMMVMMMVRMVMMVMMMTSSCIVRLDSEVCWLAMLHYVTEDTLDTLLMELIVVPERHQVPNRGEQGAPLVYIMCVCLCIYIVCVCMCVCVCVHVCLVLLLLSWYARRFGVEHILTQRQAHTHTHMHT
jgi:hypothetical protein